MIFAEPEKEVRSWLFRLQAAWSSGTEIVLVEREREKADLVEGLEVDPVLLDRPVTGSSTPINSVAPTG